MDDPIAQIRAALDDDERVARAASKPPWGSARWGQLPVREKDNDHIERHDPARTLRQVAAHRKILEIHTHDAVDTLDFANGFGCTVCAHDQLYGQRSAGWCDTVLTLAEAYGIEP